MHNHPSKAAWRKSIFCNDADACVEVAPLSDSNVAPRDSKEQDSPVLAFTPAEWAAFTAGVCDGKFDLATLMTVRTTPEEAAWTQVL
ncbi:DUF397 domain-containing protein [Nonomuraea sp. 3N208]|uniref:DUF397 domain-containing protein n=1 Tax=Nonomuraea sp. 3N208 TaxID=3457421 RepID=UPI003FD2F6B1